MVRASEIKAQQDELGWVLGIEESVGELKRAVSMLLQIELERLESDDDTPETS